jgi:hypothetical protein
MRAVLDGLEPKPEVSAPREDKHAYATALSRKLAVLVARALRPTYPQVLPTEDDIGHESPTGSSEGKKRLDVKVWDDTLGLVVLVSIKTYSFRDWDNKKKTAGRYTKNIKRNGLELKDEADVMHRRQPYSVVVALMFMPFTACDDGDPESTSDVQGVSSFASAVRRLRVRSGRSIDPDEKRFERFDLTEKLYIGLYEYDDPETRGQLRFFDVTHAPPRTGRPSASSTRSLAELVADIKDLENKRNTSGIEWEILTEEGATEDDAAE